MTMGVKLISCISNRGALNAPTSRGGSAGFTMGLKLISGISNASYPVPTSISGSTELTVGKFAKSITPLSPKFAAFTLTPASCAFTTYGTNEPSCELAMDAEI